MAAGFTDYRALARDYPTLDPYLITISRGVTINFSDPAAVRTLNQALYRVQLGLRIELPEDRLCPPMENRRTYIRWLRDIHQLTAVAGENGPLIIDIGTGASAVYPLVGCSIWPEVRFVATEIDNESHAWAKKNIMANELMSRIQLVKTTQHDKLLQPLVADQNLRCFATMCNPPFYSSEDDMKRRTAAKDGPASTIYTGSANESITPGGEAAFVEQMIHESVPLGERCRWYTSMLGLASSVESLVVVLQELKITNYAVYCFTSGTGSTRRWLLGWSFGADRLPDSLARHAQLPSVEPPSTSNERPLAMPKGITITPARVAAIFSDILLSVPGLEVISLVPLPLPYIAATRITASAVTWTRKARRAVQQASTPIPATTEPVLVCSVFVKLEFDDDEGRWTLGTRWEYGSERSAFETFSAHLATKVSQGLSQRL